MQEILIQIEILSRYSFDIASILFRFIISFLMKLALKRYISINWVEHLNCLTPVALITRAPPMDRTRIIIRLHPESIRDYAEIDDCYDSRRS